MKLLTDEQHDFLVENYKEIGNVELTHLINSTFRTSFKVVQIKNYKKNRRLASNLTGQFEKGGIPINKGTKGMFNVGGNNTSFKKGQASPNWVPVGTEIMKGDGYIYRKISDIKGVCPIKNWKQVHRIIYEDYHGVKLNAQDRIVFLDGDLTNFEIDNLALLSNNENLVRNIYDLKYNDKELSRTGVLVAKVISNSNIRKKR